MAKMLEPMVKEIQQEAVTTRRVLERVPADKLSWKPHPKSMSIGQLALDIASIPGGLSTIAQLDEFDAANANFNPLAPRDADEIFATRDKLQAAQDYLGSISESTALANWRLTQGQGSVYHPSCCHASIDHAQPLVPPSRTTVGLPPAAGRSGTGDIWA